MTGSLGPGLDHLAAELGWGAPATATPREKRAAFARLLRAWMGGFPAEIPVVKVLGTNGKGSTAAMLAAALDAAGVRTGLFTSPHLERVTERIRVAGVELAPDELDARARALRPLLLAFRDANPPALRPTFFQAVLLAALGAFAEHGVGAAIVEAGVGGATDPTAELPGPLAVVTSVGRDHLHRLGGSLTTIGLDKAGGAANGSVLLLGPGVPAPVRAAIHAAERGRLSRIVDVPSPAVAVAHTASRLEARVSFLGPERPVRLSLTGAFQLDNLATVGRALAELAGLGLGGAGGEDAWVRGLEGARWPGRFEYVPGPPELLLDAAHNAHALSALAASVRLHFPGRQRLLVFGTSREKAVEEMLPHLREIASAALLVDGFHHAVPRHELARRVGDALRVEGAFSSTGEALAAARARPARNRELVVATGSVFLVGEARRALRAAP